MYNFNTLQRAMSAQFNEVKVGTLFMVDVDKNDLWDLYLSSFPEGSNPIYKENTEHDCNCCKAFIRQAGGLVAIVNGELKSIWDIEIGGFYQPVVDALSAMVKSKAIASIFLHTERWVGTEQSIVLGEDSETIIWKHFYLQLPASVVHHKDQIPTMKGESVNNYTVFKNSMNRLSLEAVDIVLDLIGQNSLYRGQEHTNVLNSMRKQLSNFQLALPEKRELFYWSASVQLGRSGGFRNTVIGTLVEDITSGVELEIAVKKFEDKVAPINYKRPKALITQKMIDDATKTVASLGIEEALVRRFATTEDLTINNVLFADRTAQQDMGVMGMLKPQTSSTPKDFGKVEEVSINSFINNILPNAETVEMLLENNHSSNLVSLIAPVNEAKNILQWGNNFTWSYNGEVTDSMKENVKAAGGNVVGELRFSIQWNTPDRPHASDLDAHCRVGRNHIYYASRNGTVGGSSGTLDVDITRPRGVAVENIIFTDRNKMPDGDYKFYVNNFSKRSGGSFTAQIEFDSNIYDFCHDGPVNQDKEVAVITKKGNEFTMKSSMPHTKTPVEVWGVTTQEFHKVKMVMNSPNHWDGEETGNKHYFFMLEDCKNPDPARGFYNEFLASDLVPHRKVFEVLGSKLKAEPTDDQLSGVGFSSTQRNSVLCRVRGSFNRVVQINF